MKMKRIIGIIVLLLLAVVPMKAERVSPETAQKAALTFLRNNGAKASQLTDLSQKAGFKNLYIFNGEEGFVVISADDRVQPILGYSLTGTFVVDEMPENLKWWLQGYSDQIQDLKGTRIHNQLAESEWNSLLNGTPSKTTHEVVVEPLLTTTWDQNYPYNYYCPEGHVYAGCVACAMAQVMNYWKCPTTGNGNYKYEHDTYGELTANFGETTYQWDNMPSSISSTSDQDEINAIATLMYHCGVAVDMNYGPSGSSAYSNDVPNALINYFGYSNSTTSVSRSAFSDAEWIAFLQHELDEGRPLYYSGNNSNSGHAFVCDGYCSDNTFHFNWGWSGNQNGYWHIGALNPGSGGSGSGAGTYNLHNSVIAWTEPLNSMTAPTLSVSTSNGIANLTWTATEGASSYSVYRNNVRIAEGLDELSYSDNSILFGQEYNYFVRAINNQTASNPSNFVSINSSYRSITPSNLTASYDNDKVSITWTGYEGGASTELYYGLGDTYISSVENAENGVYWGQQYPSSRLAQHEGLLVDQISIYLGTTGNYTAYLYAGDTPSVLTELFKQEFSATETGWNTIEISDPVCIDVNTGLWVIFYTNASSTTLVIDQYTGTYPQEGSYYGESLGGLTCAYENYSWPIKLHLTDGTYTYNLYDGETKVNGDVPISGTSYTVENPENNTTHNYTVKTSYCGGESEASNIAGLTLGSVSSENLSLGDEDVITVSSGSTLTLTGTVSNDNAANLIIEDGGQLIHNTSAVNATLKKDITAYSSGSGTNDGWYTIASPVNDLGIGIATSGTYDLYAYDETQVLWLNQKNSANNITQFAECQGFLYANASNQSLAFAGSMPATGQSIAKTLSYQSSNTDLKGFNLMGNPFSCNLNSGDITLGGTALTTYYVVEGGSQLVTRDLTNYPIKPGQGFLVQATATGQELVFKPSSKDDDTTMPAFLCIETGDESFTDRVYIQFGQGNTLHKMILTENTCQLSLSHQDEDYAALTIESSTGELPLRFKAVHDGTHTLTVETKGLEWNYLHLIDHLTGHDIDLLLNPSYQFEAKTSDYPERFQLVFSTEPILNNTNSDFAFVANGQIIIPCFDEPYTLQIIDMTGRLVDNGHLSPGIYVVRLITANKLKTQKITLNP